MKFLSFTKKSHWSYLTKELNCRRQIHSVSEVSHKFIYTADYILILSM